MFRHHWGENFDSADPQAPSIKLRIDWREIKEWQQALAERTKNTVWHGVIWANESKNHIPSFYVFFKHIFIRLSNTYIYLRISIN